MANLLHLNWSLHSKGCGCFLCTITSYSGRNEILQVKKKKSMLSSVWASTMISLVIELSTRLINKQLSPPVYFLSSLDHCYLCFNNNSKKKKNSVKLFPIQADQVESICMNDFWLFRQCCFNAATQNWSFSITQREKQAAIESRAEHIWLQSCQHSQLDYD